MAMSVDRTRITSYVLSTVYPCWDFSRPPFVLPSHLVSVGRNTCTCQKKPIISISHKTPVQPGLPVQPAVWSLLWQGVELDNIYKCFPTPTIL